ncbi:MAG: Na(+)-translocating NADH-quinone reductase subunit C [Pseudomonadota bacterium]
MQPSETENRGLIGRLLAVSPDAPVKTIVVALILCLVASTAVSYLAVALRPAQQLNKLKDKQMNILQVAGLYEPGIDVVEAFAAFEPRLLDLRAGTFTDDFDAASFDSRAASQDPDLSIVLEEDPASIGRQSKYVTVYLLRDDAGGVDRVILPIHGYGLWSTLYGFIALEEDGNEIYGLQFYEHGETPGLGAEVDNPRWKAQWRGKRIADASGDIAIQVAKTQSAAGADYHIDALSGATLTSDGVNNLVKFWMGEQGYAPFLANLKSGDV